jgi:hypothetical protein
MPLYAFDGTWNLDKPGTEHNTNVVWFHDAYTGPKHYFKGIGTRFGPLGHIVGASPARAGAIGWRKRWRCLKPIKVAAKRSSTSSGSAMVQRSLSNSRTGMREGP